MRLYLKPFFFLLFFFLCNNYVSAQETDRAWEYFSNKQYELAVKEFKLALEIAEAENGRNKNFAEICLYLAVSLERSNKIERAISYFILCNETYQSMPGGLLEDHYGISLINLTGLFYEMGHYEKALPLSLKALENTEKLLGKGHSEYGIRLNILVGLYKSLGQYEKALPLSLVALENIEKSLGKDHPEYGKSLNNLANLYETNGQYEKALPLYLEALENTEKSLGKNHFSYGTYLDHLASLYTSMGQYEKALPLYLETLENTEKSLGKEHPYYGSSLSSLAYLYQSMGQSEKALPLYNEALENAKKTLSKSHPDYGFRLNSLASLYTSMGQNEKALPLYIEALENIEKSLGKDHSRYGIILNNLAALYESIGHYEKALPMYLEALENSEKSHGKDYSQNGFILNNLASLYRSMGQSEKALPLLLEAFEDTERSLGKDHPYYGTNLNNLASLYEAKGQYEKALPLYLEALENVKRSLGKDHSDYGISLNNLAGLYESMGQFKKALPLHIEALGNTEKSLGKVHSSYSTHLINLASLYESMGQSEKALPLYQQGLAVIEKNIDLNFAFLSENEKEMYLKTALYNFEIFYSFIILYKTSFLEEVSDVYNHTLTTKGMLLYSSTGMRSAILSSDNEELKSKYDEWIGLKKQIARLYSTQISKRYENVENLDERANILERALVQGSQRFMDYQGLNAVNWQDVRDVLKPNEAAIEFMNFKYFNKEWSDKTLYCALVLKQNSEYPEMIPLFWEKELEYFWINSESANKTELVALLYGEKRGTSVLRSSNSICLSDSLYSLIWNPIDSLLRGVEKVYYSPSGKLNSISFSAIPYNDSLLLSDKYQLEYVSTTASLVNRISSKIDLLETKAAIYGGLQYDVTTEEMLACSQLYENDESDELLTYNRSYTPSDSSRGDSWNYLRGTLLESNNISNIITKKNVSTSLYQGVDGNEESFKVLTGNNSPRIIHLATHGFFFPDLAKQRNNNQIVMSHGDKKIFKQSDNPLIRSGLIMSGANLAWKGEAIPDGIDDGILTAYEVSGMDLLNTQLVVLSACETGLGDIKGSEGIYGLQRSFKMAGVDFLIMSLWQVPDKETSEFMTMFYTKLLETKDIRFAFEESQKTMRYKYDPYYWAAFILIA